MSIETIYQSQIKSLPVIERLRLARLIMDDLAESAPNWVVETSDAWSHQDLYDIGQASLRQARLTLAVAVK
jgi:hypothetical protein